jgi:integrase
MEERRAHSRINQPPIKVITSEIRTVQELLGHRDVKTTMIDTHVLNRGPAGVRSPVDAL